MELILLWQIILRRKAAIVISGLCVIAMAILTCLFVTPVYETVARVKIKRADESQVVMSNVPLGFGALDYIAPTAAVTQAEVIKSAAVIEPVIRELNLIERWTIIDTIVSLIPWLKPDEKTYVRVDDYVDASIVWWFLQRRNIIVEAIEDSDVVEVYVYSDRLEEARDVANSVVGSYIRFNEILKASQGGTGSGTLLKELERAKSKLTSANQNLKDFREKEVSLNFDDQSRAIASEMNRLEKELFDLRRRMKIIQASLAGMAQELNRQPEYKVSRRGVQANPLVDNAKAEISDLKARLSALSVELTPNHVEIQSLKSQIRALESTLANEPAERLNLRESTLNKYRDELEKRYSDAKIEYKELGAAEHALVQDINTFKERLSSLAANKSRLSDLELTIELTKTNYAKLSDDLRAAQLASSSAVANVAVITPAPLPDENNPYYPDWGLYLAIAVMLAPFVGLGIALLVDYVDDSFKTPDEVEAELKLPILASFPRMRKTDFTSTGSLAALSSSARPLLDLRFGVLEKLSKKAEKGVMTIVSVHHGEGKSTIVRGLGYSLAHSGKRVLLLDLNVTSPVLHKLFGLSPSPGVAELLTEKVSLEETICATNNSNLAFIPCEPSNAELAGLLDSSRMRSLIKSLQRNFDIILIDTPALASGPEGFILSSRADGVLFVAVPLKTPKSLAKEAQERLQSLGASLVGIVLNKMKA